MKAKFLFLALAIFFIPQLSFSEEFKQAEVIVPSGLLGYIQHDGISASFSTNGLYRAFSINNPSHPILPVKLAKRNLNKTPEKIYFDLPIGIPGLTLGSNIVLFIPLKEGVILETDNQYICNVSNTINGKNNTVIKINGQSSTQVNCLYGKDSRKGIYIKNMKMESDGLLVEHFGSKHVLGFDAKIVRYEK